MSKENNSFLNTLDNFHEIQKIQININNSDENINISDYHIDEGILFKKDKFYENNIFKDIFIYSKKDYESENEKEYVNMYEILDIDNSFKNYSLIYENVKKENNFLNKKRKIFDIKKEKKYYRFDYYIKAFKANYLNYLVNLVNRKIEECMFDSKLGKFHMPNKKKYQGNTKEQDNKDFIKKKFKEVLIDYDESSIEGITRQKKNKYLLDKIYKIMFFPFNECQKNLKTCLEMTIEEGLELYYESEQFKKFKARRIIKFYDSKFQKERNRNFSLLEKNGFIKLVKMPSYCVKKANFE